MTKSSIQCEADIPGQYGAVELLYDEKSQCLNAVLTLTDKDPHITFPLLQEKIEQEGYGSFMVKSTALEDVLSALAYRSYCPNMM